MFFCLWVFGAFQLLFMYCIYTDGINMLESCSLYVVSYLTVLNRHVLITVIIDCDKWALVMSDFYKNILVLFENEHVCNMRTSEFMNLIGSIMFYIFNIQLHNNIWLFYSTLNF